VILADGKKRCYIHGKAIFFSDCTQLWYKDGKKHRDGDLPAAILADGKRYWYLHGKAVILLDGTQLWYTRTGRYGSKMECS